MKKPKRSHALPPRGRDRSRKEADISSPAIPGAGATGAVQVSPSEAAAAAKRAAGPQAPASSAPTAGASLDAIPASPPADVLEQMARAQQTYEQLAAQGQSLHFTQDAGGRTTVELRDSGGQLLRTLSLSEALELAAGAGGE